MKIFTYFKKMNKLGAAMVEYAVILAFVAAVGSSFTDNISPGVSVIMIIFKKILKIILLYLIFGIAIALAITVFGGGYQNMIVGQLMGFMTIYDFIFLNVYVALLWLPLSLIMLFSLGDFYRYMFLKPISIAIIVVFLLMVLIIILKKHK